MVHDDADRVMSLPAARAWSDAFGGGLEALDYLGRHVTPTQALAVVELVWPRLVEHRGCVILSEQFDEGNFNDWWSSLNGDRPRIEAVMNHLHLWDIFTERDEAGSDVALERLLRVLDTTWSAALATAFPGRSFVVDVDPYDYGPTITFWSGEKTDA